MKTFTVNNVLYWHYKDELPQSWTGIKKLNIIFSGEDDLEVKNEHYSMQDLIVALDESLILQAHYASLLNMHDGGERRIYETIPKWIARLKETGTIK